MSRILTGIKSTGIPHIGNVLGVMLPIIDIVNNSLEKVFILIADLHSLTKIKNIKDIKDNTYKIAAAWLACGLNIDKAILYKQSDIPQITELFWYLNCFFPYKRLKLSHSFKNIKNSNKNRNIGLFTYPILMAADILLFETKIVFVGKDQLQHIEITRKIAKKINNKIKKIFVIPEAKMKKNSMSIPGIDGSKMSKSKKNTINIFYSKKEIKKQIMNIHTNNNKISYYEELNNDIIYNIYILLANKAEILNFEKKILFEKEFGYEKAKIELYKYIIYSFSNERKKYKFFLKNKNIIYYILNKGAEEAQKIANITMIKIKNAFNKKK
ncbi:tryptophan--tRNA ligase [Candidatus Karelsulcia muelleri]|uniref:Tryptophan--tRNA ligase n=1 Tax=Candidatus Karelsulcia muelleri PSPU TaxID=1189303 RepID=A0AAD1AZ44_9FLAO|nr:tryptophan--tRNA ligase [Candidatus Karelsulcia muelleri]NJJ98673.1 tryptophan--tRNA ligase [Candidatus Karelsulcia muelleri]BAO66329.1 tryptophanyl-tRNA synthetase [Candidatus Karelsulcia muelleri PSPU]